MVNYELIQNIELRQLVLGSQSIATLSDEEKNIMVERMAKTPAPGQLMLIQSLRDDQIPAGTTQHATVIVSAMTVEEKNRAVTQIKKDFEKTVLTEHEKTDAIDSAQAADKLLNNI